MWMRDGCRVYMGSYVASNGPCFMVTWNVFKNHLLEVGRTPDRESVGFWNAHERWSILFYHVWGPAWIDIRWDGIWLRAWSRRTSHYTWGSVTALCDFGGVLGWRPLDTFFWALTIPWSRLLARVWRGALNPESLEVNLCILSCCEYGSWDLPLHTGSRVLSP